MPDLKLTENEIMRIEHNYQDNVRALLCEDWRTLVAENKRLREALTDFFQHYSDGFVSNESLDTGRQVTAEMRGVTVEQLGEEILKKLREGNHA